MKKYLGIDVGGTKIKYGVYSEKGEKIDFGIVDSETESTQEFINVIKEIKEKFNDIEEIGLSIPCVLNSKTGEILEEGNIKALRNVNLKEVLEKQLEAKVYIENDANCVALAEKWIGNGENIENFVCVTIGTGIGGAIVINDRLHTGKNFIAGEFGFMIIDDLFGKGLERDYGQVSSTRNLVRDVSKLKGFDIDGYYVFDNLNKDGEIKEIYDKWITCLASGIRNICFVLDPEKILIGGGVSKRPQILNDLKCKLKEILPMEYRDVWKVDTCKYYNESGVIGAVYKCMENR